MHFQAEVNILLQEYAYRPQTNGVVEAANKNIKRILRKIVETSRDWSKKLPFALWVYRTSFRTFTGTTSYSLVYGMETCRPSILSSSHMSFIAISWWPINTRVAYLF